MAMNISDTAIKWLNSLFDAEAEPALWAELSGQEQDLLQSVKQQCTQWQKRFAEQNEALQYYKSAFNALPIPMVIKDKDAKFLYINKEYDAVINTAKVDVIGTDVTELPFFTEQEKEIIQKENLYAIKNKTTVQKDFCFSKDERKRNYVYWLGGFETENRKAGVLCLYYDITMFQKMLYQLSQKVEGLELQNQDMIKQSSLDPLTGAYNRSVMDVFLDKAFSEAKKNGHGFSLLMLDIDHFKQVNDTYGHLIGDQVLQVFVMLLQKTLRGRDVIIRYGGEEFLIILNDAKDEYVYKIAERIRMLVEKNLFAPDHKPITVSIGIGMYQNEETVADLLQKADDNLYKAKSRGRNIVYPEV